MIHVTELDISGVIEGDNDPPQEMGDSSLEVTDDMLELASAKRAEAMEAASEGLFCLFVFLKPLKPVGF